MSILIKDYEMPKSCSKCFMFNWCWLDKWMEEHDAKYYYENRRKDCPLVEIVRCKDCKWYISGSNECEEWTECGRLCIALPSDDWFCRSGERREDEVH